MVYCCRTHIPNSAIPVTCLFPRRFPIGISREPRLLLHHEQPAEYDPDAKPIDLYAAASDRVRSIQDGSRELEDGITDRWLNESRHNVASLAECVANQESPDKLLENLNIAYVFANVDQRQVLLQDAQRKLRGTDHKLAEVGERLELQEKTFLEKLGEVQTFGQLIVLFVKEALRGRESQSTPEAHNTPPDPRGSEHPEDEFFPRDNYPSKEQHEAPERQPARPPEAPPPPDVLNALLNLPLRDLTAGARVDPLSGNVILDTSEGKPLRRALARVASQRNLDLDALLRGLNGNTEGLRASITHTFFLLGTTKEWQRYRRLDEKRRSAGVGSIRALLHSGDVRGEYVDLVRAGLERAKTSGRWTLLEMFPTYDVDHVSALPDSTADL